MINVLSVDWDYFFPDPTWYDWGHREDPIFLEFLWQIRATNRNLITEAWAVHEMRVNRVRRHRFWERVCPDPTVAFLYVAESHKDLLPVLKGLSFAKVTVWNFDAHHDLGYSNLKTEECDNWAWWAWQNEYIKEYHLVYPEWRLNGDEGEFLTEKPTSFHFFPPYDEMPNRWDAVFVCRSSAWTPSWQDDAWLRFVGWWARKNPLVWRLRRTCEFVQRKRYPNLQQAEELRVAHINQFLDQIYGEEEVIESGSLP